jgi:polar amino acid transport system permease protein
VTTLLRDRFGFAYDFNWMIIFEERYFSLLVMGLKYTALLTIVTTAASVPLGIVVGVMRSSNTRVLSRVATAYVEVFRNIPGMFWVLFFYFGLPTLLPQVWSRALNASTNYALLAAILGLTFDNSSYVAEITRAGIQSLVVGQHEAGRSIGLTDWQRWRYIILPQAIRTVVPPLGTRCIQNLKSTSLAMVIAVPELSWATRQIESLSFRGFEVTTIATAIYVSLCLVMAAGVNWLERRLAWGTGVSRAV